MGQDEAVLRFQFGRAAQNPQSLQVVFTLPQRPAERVQRVSALLHRDRLFVAGDDRFPIIEMLVLASQFDVEIGSIRRQFDCAAEFRNGAFKFVLQLVEDRQVAQGKYILRIDCQGLFQVLLREGPVAHVGIDFAQHGQHLRVARFQVQGFEGEFAGSVIAAQPVERARVDRQRGHVFAVNANRFPRKLVSLLDPTRNDVQFG